MVSIRLMVSLKPSASLFSYGPQFYYQKHLINIRGTCTFIFEIDRILLWSNLSIYMRETPSGRLKPCPCPSHPTNTYTCGIIIAPRVSNGVAHVCWHLEIDRYDWMGSAMYSLGVQMNHWVGNCFFLIYNLFIYIYINLHKIKILTSWP